MEWYEAIRQPAFNGGLDPSLRRSAFKTGGMSDAFLPGQKQRYDQGLFVQGGGAPQETPGQQTARYLGEEAPQEAQQDQRADFYGLGKQAPANDRADFYGLGRRA